MDLAPVRRRRRLVGMTPMIDLVFLLLVFFMLASKFSTERAISLTGGAEGAAAVWFGPPRLIEIGPEVLRFNGRTTPLPALASTLAGSGVAPGDPLLIRSLGETDMQRLTDLLDTLDAAGYTRPVLLP